MNQAEILEVLEKRGAILHGHFMLSSGRHSDVFAQKFRVFEDPHLTQRFGEELAAAFPGAFDVVAAPAVGAIVLGFATALATSARFIFAEREGGVMRFRRGFGVEPHERVLVVEDVVTTAGSAREVVAAVRTAGGDPVGVAALIDRGDPMATRNDLGAPMRALVKLEVSSWAPDECPLCRSNQPLSDPGSRRLSSL